MADAGTEAIFNAGMIDQTAPDVQPAPEPTDPLAKYLDTIAPELREFARPVLEAAHKEWEAGATEKFQVAAEAERLRTALRENPRGTIAYLGQSLGVPVQFTDEAPAREPQARPTGRPADSGEVDTQIAALKERAKRSTNFEDQWDAMEQASRLQAKKAAAEEVGVVRAAQLELQDSQALERMRRDYPDVNVDRLWPQIKRRQASIRERPHLFADEALAIELFPQAVQELRRLRRSGARAADPADRTRAMVTGPGGAAPTGAPDPYGLTADQLMSVMTGLGLRKESG